MEFPKEKRTELTLKDNSVIIVLNWFQEVILMENTKKIKISLNEIYPDIKDKIDNGGTVRLPITGISMRPLLVWGRDTVDLVKCESPKKRRYNFLSS